MIQIKHIILTISIVFSNLFSQCDNNSIADYNDDNILDVLDMIVLVDQIMNEVQDIENSDINLDGFVDILDIVRLILKILNPYPLNSEITYLDYSDNTIYLNWELNSSPLFSEYQLLMSNDIDDM